MNTPLPRPHKGTPFLALGCAFLPIGIATRQPALLAIGLTFLGIALILFVRGPKP